MLKTNTKKSTEDMETLFFSMQRAIALYLKKRHREDVGYISPLQIQVLSYIDEKPDLLMKELADFLSVEPPSVTSLVDSMVRDNLISRKIDQTDKRIVHLQITDKGKDLLQRGEKQIKAHFREVMSSLNDKERKQITEIYKKIYNYFSKK